jgi:flagellar motility protein MotE (MotC chaperone)
MTAPFPPGSAPAAPAAGRALAGTMLAAGLLLVLAKAALLVQAVIAWSGPTLELAEAAPIPWPRELPEPAAGPAEPPPATAGPVASEPAANPGLDPAPPSAEPEPMPPAAPALLALTPGQLDAAEIAALQQLAARRAQLDERARQLDTREVLIERALARLDEQLDRLGRLKAAVEALIAQHQRQEDGRLAELVKIYETMKPKAAAEIFDQLELPVVLDVVSRMRAAKSAAVLAEMDPATAKQITAELARRAELPELEG